MPDDVADDETAPRRPVRNPGPEHPSGTGMSGVGDGAAGTGGFQEHCGCIRCSSERASAAPASEIAERGIRSIPHFRYACEICGNKRCPHHTDHRLSCTDSNEPGQEGSAFR